MENNLDPQDYALKLFLEEAVELLQIIRGIVLDFLENPSVTRVYHLIQAIDLIKVIKEGARGLDLANIEHLADRFEKTLRSCSQEKSPKIERWFLEELQQINEALWETLLVSYTEIKRSQTDRFLDADHSVVKNETWLDTTSSETFGQISLGEAKHSLPSNDRSPSLPFFNEKAIAPLENKTRLPEVERSRSEDAKIVENLDVVEALARLEKLLKSQEVDAVELKKQIESFLAISKKLKRPELIEIAQTSLSALSISSKSAQTIGQIALAGFYGVQELDNVILPKELPTETLEEPATPLSSRHKREQKSSSTILLDWVINTEDKRIIEQIKRSHQHPSDLLSLVPKFPSESEINSLEQIRAEAPTLPELSLKNSNLFGWLIGSTLFFLPNDSIKESLTPQAEQIIQSGKEQFLKWHQKILSISQLSELIKRSSPLKSNFSQMWQTSSNSAISLMLVVQLGSQTIAVESAIEHLVTMTRLSIISFESNLALPSYCAGYSIWKNERIVKVIDVIALLNQFFCPN